MYRELSQVFEQFTQAGQPFEVKQVEVQGVSVRAWAHAPNSLRDVWAMAAAHGDKDYLIYRDERVSYAQAQTQVAQLANWMVDRGIGKGDRVAVAMRNFPEWMLSYWAVTSIGAEVVGMNAWWVGDEMLYALEDSSPALLIADSERLERFELIRTKLTTAPEVLAVRAADTKTEVAAHWHELASDDRPLPEAVIDTDDVACIFYTSGTTGYPKGAQLTHRNCTNNIMSMIFIGLSFTTADARCNGEPDPVPDPDKNIAAIIATPLFHVTANNCAAQAATLMGGKLIHLHKWDAAETLRIIEQENVTSFSGVPVMARELLTHPNFANTDTSQLETIGAGGAAVQPDLVEKIDQAALIPGQGFGMTEAAGIICSNRGQYLIDKPASVGPIMPNYEVKTVNEDGETLNQGDIGEICIRGAQVIKGYANKPEATAKAIVDGWLFTGDVGYVDEDGFIFLVDRSKDMIIRGGENIYSLEVEAAVYKLDGIAECAVFAVDDERLGEEVGAAIYAPVSDLNDDDIREFCKTHLSAFKIPRHIWFMDEPLPRNANGKFVKKTLKETLSPA